MAVVENPTVRAYDDPLHINSLYFPDLPIRSDDVSVAQYVAEFLTGFTLTSYTRDPSEGSHTSNDGGRTYNYYDGVTGYWMNQFGYEGIVVDITYS